MYSDILAPDADRKAPFLSHLWDAITRQKLLVIVVLSYCTIALGLNLLYGDTIENEKVGGFIGRMPTFVPVMLYILLMWRVTYMRLYVPKEQHKGWLKADLKRAFSDPERISFAVVTIPLMAMMLVSFALLKRLIPVLNPFAWDMELIQLDQMLHFGMDPWEIAHAIAGNPYVITLVTAAYNFWLFLMYFSLIFACFSKANRAARMQYLIAFVLVWAIGGNILATVFSSVGPVYVHELGLGDHFAPLLDLLRMQSETQPLSVVESQAALWDMYASPQSVSGISAFPSMHVASTTLMMIYARAYNRRFGQVMTVFALVIMLGSVLLAWHYAVDGYVGALVAFGCWWIAGKICRRFA